MEKTVRQRAYAKLNLTLGVTGKRADGYHLLDSLMVTTSLFDEVTVTRDREVVVTATGMLLPYQNTLRKAAEGYRALTGRGARIHVYKHIPAEAGLGGGSADAAAVLLAMQRIYGELEPLQLYEIALRVGADVPFCLKGGLCRARGIGEVLDPLPMGKPLQIVIAKPERGVSTKALFTALKLPQPMPETAKAIASLAAGDAKALSPLLFNALEESAVSLVPEIGELIDKLKDLGALGARMTGSGSAVFGIFETKAQAEAAAEAMKAVCPFAAAVETV